MSRAIPEWVADHDDQAIPKRVKHRVWLRCAGRCALTGKKLAVGDDYDFDHIKRLADGGRHAESNLQVVWRSAHREKSAAEVHDAAKADRIHAKHFGYAPPTKTPLKSRGFAPTRPRAERQA